MNIIEILQNVFDDLGLTWSAIAALAQCLEALVILFSAPLVIYQLRQLRSQSIENRVAGLKAALEVLKSDTFKTISEKAMSETMIHGVNWRDLLEEINLVSLLIDQQYTDEYLLLSLKGHELAAIDRYLQTHQITDDIKKDLTTTYMGAMRLLARASRWKKT